MRTCAYDTVFRQYMTDPVSRIRQMTDITSEGDLPTIVSPRAVPLQLKALPVAVSFGQFNDTVLTDPTVEEESLLNATVTVVEDALYVCKCVCNIHWEYCSHVCLH